MLKLASVYMSTQLNSIVHIDMDTFFVSVERLLDPKLKNRPVIVGGNPFGRGVVAGCSYEARAYGVHSAMPIRRAYQLCPQAVYLRGNYLYYSEYSRLITQILHELVPVTEKSSVDEFYIDLSHAERLKGSAYDWACEIQRTINGETQLPLSFGLAKNKLVAKVATTQKAKRTEHKHFEVERGHEREFLAPFPIRAMPGIGEVTEHTLLNYGILTIGQLAKTPTQALERTHGKTGRVLIDKANGIDHSPVTPTREQKSFSRETTFSEDTLEVDALLATLLSLASDLGADLRNAKQLASKFSLKLRYSDFTTVTRTINTSHTNSDQDIFHLARKLFLALWTRRIRVRLLGIEASHLLEDIEQHYLFAEEGEKQQIYRAFDVIRARYGTDTIGFAAAMASNG